MCFFLTVAPDGGRTKEKEEEEEEKKEERERGNVWLGKKVTTLHPLSRGSVRARKMPNSRSLPFKENLDETY